MGASRHVTTRILGNISLTIELWVCSRGNVIIIINFQQDTGNIERYNSFIPMYLKGCACVIILYDILDY